MPVVTRKRNRSDASDLPVPACKKFKSISPEPAAQMLEDDEIDLQEDTDGQTRWIDSTTRVMTVQYKAAGRGKKENFRNKKDTLMRKADVLSYESGAEILVLVHQPQHNRWHYYVTPSASNWLTDVVKPLVCIYLSTQLLLLIRV